MYLWTINIYSCITFIILKYTNSSWSSVSKNNQIKKWAEYLDRYFPKEDIQMAKKHMKRCSTSLTIRELHIKITMSVVIIKKSTNNKCWNEYGEKEILLHCWWECKLVQLLWKTVWRFLKKLGIKPPYDPAIPLLRIYRQNDNSKRYMHPYVHSSTVHNNQDMSIDRWMDKEVVVHTHNGILFSHRKKRIWVSSNEVDEPGAYYTEWSKSERERQILYIKYIERI